MIIMICWGKLNRNIWVEVKLMHIYVCGRDGVSIQREIFLLQKGGVYSMLKGKWFE